MMEKISLLPRPHCHGYLKITSQSITGHLKIIPSVSCFSLQSHSPEFLTLSATFSSAVKGLKEITLSQRASHLQAYSLSITSLKAKLLLWVMV